MINLAEEADYDDVQARLAGIQRLLVIAGYDAYPIDGVQGAKTQAAIAKFLNERKLGAEAVATPAFFDALVEAVRNPEGVGFSWCKRHQISGDGVARFLPRWAPSSRAAGIVWNRASACARICAAIRAASTVMRKRSMAAAALSNEGTQLCPGVERSRFARAMAVSSWPITRTAPRGA